LRHTEDIKLAEEAVNGNPTAFARLVKSYESSLYQVSYAMLRSDSDSVDAAQEAILQAYRSIGQLREPRYFKTWLIRILINQCNRILDQRKKIVPLDSIAEPSVVMDHEERLDIQQAVLQLESELRVVVTLFYMEDLSYRDIAEMLDVPEGTVKSRLNRAKTKLAAIIDPSHEGRVIHER
jgi:RNA polymerase sigma-70 factor, ECF subfamily